MNVVMVGHSDVGKTTYAAAMYHAMRQNGRAFTLQATSGREDRALVARGEAILAGRYPPPSARASTYRMYLRRGGHPILHLLLHDHRGGALFEPVASAPESADLQVALRAADAFLLFGDAEAIVAERRRPVPPVRKEITDVLRELAARDLNRTVSVVIVLTKIDKLCAEERDQARMEEPFRGFLDAAQDAPHVSATVVPVACGPQPMNVLRPILWALQHALVQQANDHANRAQHQMANAQYAAGQATWWSRVHHTFDTGAPNHHGHLDMHLSAATHEWRQAIETWRHAMQLTTRQT